jgi:hypothetical protein
VLQMSEREVEELAQHPGIRAFARLLRHADYSKVEPMTTTKFNPQEYETTGAAARRAGRSQSWIYGQMKAGRIRGLKVGGRWSVCSADVDALLANAQRSGEPTEGATTVFDPPSCSSSGE